MLLKCSLENWMSFRDPVTFSMIGSRERQHAGLVPHVAKYRVKILPISAIYGGNASGKTNFFKAFSFAKGFVVRGTHPESLIAIDTFQLDDLHKMEQPARFMFELLIDESVYEFSFAVTRKAVTEEKLVEVLAARERVLYDRKNGLPNFDSSLEKDQALHFAFRGTRDNQLFLTNSVFQKIETFKPVYDWFKYTLELIAPDSRFAYFEQFFDEQNPLYFTMNTKLFQFDTGIVHLGGDEIPFDQLPIPEFIKVKLRDELAEGMSVRLLTDAINERFVVTRKNGKFISKKLVAFHKKSDGAETKFEMMQESDGSQRIIDLLPAFLEVAAPCSKKVYIIDEVDRSLHTLLIRRLLEDYLSHCSKMSRSQLLFTTHNVLLMDQALLRRDEMWVAEQNAAGVSHLVAFSEYKDVRYDKDIRKSYLQGRLGGIPRIFTNAKNW
jgi:uncharacterized protein